MTLLADLLSTVFERRYLWSGQAPKDDRPISELIDKLMDATGEVTGLAVAQQILERYGTWEDGEKLKFFHHLAEDMNIIPDQVRSALKAYEEAQSGESYRTFIHASEPPRQEFIRRLNQVPGGTRRLVQMRADLLRLGKDDKILQALDLDFRHLFASWFNRGFLVLRPISWESPAYILEKIIAYEAVHAIGSWDDLRRRLQPSDRRCFAFFHPAMPDEPLIFVEVALTKGVPGSIQNLLAESRDTLSADEANTAVFYSISNCQAGLANISFGNFLIKQVAADLSLSLASLKTFVTLSPIPGFADWFQSLSMNGEPPSSDRLRALAAYYLMTEKDPKGRPMDAVARFHLNNGALVHQIHSNADISSKGQEQSKGMMVNYLYDLAKVGQNHEKFTVSGEIAASGQIRSLCSAGEKAISQELKQ